MQALQYPSGLVGSLVAFTSQVSQEGLKELLASNWRSPMHDLLHPSFLETFGRSLGLLHLKVLCWTLRTAA